MQDSELLQMRQARLDAIRDNKSFKQTWTEENEKIHKRNMELKKQRESIDLKIKTTQTLMKKRQEEVCRVEN